MAKLDPCGQCGYCGNRFSREVSDATNNTEFCSQQCQDAQERECQHDWQRLGSGSTSTGVVIFTCRRCGDREEHDYSR